MRLPPREETEAAVVFVAMTGFWAISEGQRRGLIPATTLWFATWAACLVVAGVAAWRLR